MSIAGDSSFITEGSGKRLTQAYPNIFGGMMPIDLQISAGFDMEVQECVPGEELQHVVQETDAGGDFGLAAAIQFDRDLDIGFAGNAMNRSGSWHGAPFKAPQDNRFTGHREGLIAIRKERHPFASRFPSKS